MITFIMGWFTSLTLYVLGRILGVEFLQYVGAIGVILFLAAELIFEVKV